MYYVLSSRFQPLTKLLEAEIEWLVENTKPEDKIILGVVNYEPLLINNKEASNWKRFNLEYNPLTYWERFRLLKDFVHERQWWDKIVSITPSPRPSVDMAGAENFLPPKQDRVMCVPIVHETEQEEEKKEGLINQKEQVLEIPAHSFDNKLKIINEEMVICLIALGNDVWKEFVDVRVYDYLQSLDLKGRISQRLTRETAIETLRRTYRRIASADEQILLYGPLKEYLTDIAPPKSANIQSNQLEKRILKARIENLFNDMAVGIQELETNAPMQFRTFQQDLKTIDQLLQDVDRLLSQSDLDRIKEKYTEIETRWRERNR